MIYMLRYINKKKFLLLVVLALLLSSCAISTRSPKDGGAKRKIGAVETEYHFFFDKLFRDEKLTADEEKRYMEKKDEAMSLLTNAMEVGEQCITKAQQIDGQFTDKHLGKNSVTYADTGARGAQYNLKLSQAIRNFAACVEENEEKIQEIAIYNKFIYDALLAEYNTGLRVFQAKEADRDICAKTELNSEQKAICEVIDENYLISQAQKAYVISPNIQERKKTKKEIKEEMGNLTNVIKQIQELENPN